MMGEASLVRGQSCESEHVRFCFPAELHVPQSLHVHVSAVHAGVQLCVVSGEAVEANAQSFVRRQLRVCVPPIVQVDQSSHVQVSVVQFEAELPPPPPPPPPAANTNEPLKSAAKAIALIIKNFFICV